MSKKRFTLGALSLGVILILVLGATLIQAAPQEITVTPDPVAFGAPSGSTSQAQTLTITNSDTDTNLTITGFSLVGTDAASFVVVGGFPATPIVLAPGASQTIDIQFAPASAGFKTATLQVASDDPVTPTAQVTLNGIAAVGVGGSNEPSLQYIFDAFDLQTSTGDDDPTTTTIHSDWGTAQAFPRGDEVVMPLFQKAGPGNVTVEAIAAYAYDTDTGVPELYFGWYQAGLPASTTEMFALDSRVVVPGNDQALNPSITGTTSFDPGTDIFGFYGRFIPFGNRFVYTEDALNASWSAGNTTHHVRVYLYTPGGVAVPNAYVLAWEEFTAGWDYNDIVVIVRNVTVPTLQPEIEVSTTNLTFTALEGTTSAPQTVTISNIGDADLTVSSLVLSGTDAALFNFVGGNPGTFVLTPGETRSIELTFSPTTSGTFNANLAINSDDPTNGTVNVALQGDGLVNTGTYAGTIDFLNLDWQNFDFATYPGMDYLHTWLSFNYISNKPVTASGWQNIQDHNLVTLRIYNNGADPLQLTSLSISDTTEFTLPNGELATPPAPIPPGDFYDLDVQFIENTGDKGLRTQKLYIASSDPANPVSEIQLAGGYQFWPEGGNEITEIDIANAFGITTNMDKTGIYGRWEAAGEEILVKNWERLDPTNPIYIRQLAAFHSCCYPTSGAFFKLDFVSGADHSRGHDSLGGQSLLPLNASATGPYEYNVNRDEEFFFVVDSSWEACDAACGDNHAIRVWPYRNPSGQIIPGMYVVAQDYTGGGANYDYQDNIYLVANIRPVTTDTDLSLIGSDIPDPVATNATLTYNFEVNNLSTVAADNAVVTINLPGSLTGVVATPDQGSCTGFPILTCDLGTVNASQTVNIIVTATSPPVGSSLTTTASVATSTDEVTTSNNNVTLTTTVGTGEPGTITIIKDATPDGPQAFNFSGDLGTFSLVDDGGSTPNTFARSYNFELPGTTTPAGYEKDDGSAYGLRANGETYGWMSMTTGNPINGTPNARDYDGTLTGSFMQPQYYHCCSTGVQDELFWQHAVPNGRYQVTVGVGDNRAVFDSIHVARVQGVQAVYLDPTWANRNATGTVTVDVTDGLLKVDFIGGTHSKIDFVEIVGVPMPNNEVAFGNVAAGSYTVTETAIGGWSLDNIVCSGGGFTNVANGVTINLAAGGNVTCTFVNNQIGGPTAVDDTATVDAGAAVIVDVLANDLPDTAPLDTGSVLAGTVTPTQGAIVINANGTITYTADAGATGTDTFTYTVADTNGLRSAEATVTVTINAAPVANDDADSVAPGASVDVDVLANDTDDNGLDVASVLAGSVTPTQGAIVINANGTITYTADAGATGTDTFTYTVADASGLRSNEATVTITIVTTSPPIANDDTLTIDEDDVPTIDILGNDTDPDSDALDPATVIITSGPNDAALVDNGNGTVTVTPDANYNGTITFTYTVEDVTGAVSNEATVTITVNPVPDDPVAVDDTAGTVVDTAIDIDVLANDSDPDGDALDPTTVAIGGTTPANGNVVVNLDGTITYTPDPGFIGDDTFSYTVEDATGAVSNEVIVTVTVNPPGPAVEIAMTPAIQYVANGDNSTFTITVTNTGGEVLNNVVVLITNSVGGITPDVNCQSTIGTLAVGGVSTYTCSDQGITQDYSKTAIVNADPANGDPTLNEQVSADVVAVDAGILITKTPATQTIASGGTADFTITVTNTGSADLTNIVITDALTPACDADSGTYTELATLAVGADFTYTCSAAGVVSSFTNEITAEGTEISSGAVVNATATADVVVDTAAITIAKTPNSQIVLSGNDADFTITVTNSGNIGLVDVVVTDTLTPACDADSGTYPELASLVVGADFTYTCSAAAVTTDFTNEATVTANPLGGGPAVTDSDTADVQIQLDQPAITILKTALTPSVLSNGTAVFEITVTNNGNVDLDNVTVTDALAPDCDRSYTTLAVGASQTYTCEVDNVTTGFTNEATASGASALGGAVVTDTAQAAVEVAGMTVTKTTTTPVVTSGGTADFTITVTNTGEANLFNVTVSDALAPACAANSSTQASLATMAPGAVVTYTCSQPGVTADFTNIVLANGVTGDGLAVNADDDQLVVVGATAPSLNVSANPVDQTVAPGSTATVTITVINNGNDTLNNVTVMNNTAAACDRTSADIAALASMAPGAVVTYTCDITNVTSVINNQVVGEGTPLAGGAAVTDNASFQVKPSGNLFDPPFGVKTVNEVGETQLEWGFYWLNRGAAPATVRIEDGLPQGVAYVPGSLKCEVRGSSVTVTCKMINNNLRVQWEGTLHNEANPNITELADSSHALVVTFRTEVPADVTFAENRAQAFYDDNGDGELNARANSNRVRWERDGGVTIADAGASVSGSPVADGITAAITKTVSDPFVAQGDRVTFTITLNNTTSNTVSIINMTDNMPEQFVIVSTSANKGSVTSNGQTISFSVTGLAPGESAIITIDTQVRSDVGPFAATNTACMTDGKGNSGCASVDILNVTTLPATGESPWTTWRPVIFLLAGLMVLLSAGWTVQRKRSKNR